MLKINVQEHNSFTAVFIGVAAVALRLNSLQREQATNYIHINRSHCGFSFVFLWSHSG
jgi:hypothetical protein